MRGGSSSSNGSQRRERERASESKQESGCAGRGIGSLAGGPPGGAFGQEAGGGKSDAPQTPAPPACDASQVKTGFNEGAGLPLFSGLQSAPSSSSPPPPRPPRRLFIHHLNPTAGLLGNYAHIGYSLNKAIHQTRNPASQPAIVIEEGGDQ